MNKSDISTFDALYKYLSDLLSSGVITLDEIKDAIENKKKMEDDLK